MPGQPVIASPGLTIFCTARTSQQLVKFDVLSHEREQADESKGSKPKCGGVQEKGGKERGNSLNENLAAAKSFSTLTQHGV